MKKSVLTVGVLGMALTFATASTVGVPGGTNGDVGTPGTTVGSNTTSVGGTGHVEWLDSDGDPTGVKVNGSVDWDQSTGETEVLLDLDADCGPPATLDITDSTTGVTSSVPLDQYGCAQGFNTEYFTQEITNDNGVTYYTVVIVKTRAFQICVTDCI